MLTPPAALEALLFVSSGPASKRKLATLLHITEEQLALASEALRNELRERGIALVETEAELELRSSPDAAALVQSFRESEFSKDLGKASLETLAVIAYKDGATRSDIDWVRGVNSSASVRTLLVRGLVEGHEDSSDKRRVRYSLTTEALAHLGLGSVQELPQYDTLAAQTSAAAEEPLQEQE